jgi:hypothetical protein
MRASIFMKTYPRIVLAGTAFALAWAGAAWSAEPVVISFAQKPVALIRDTAVYQAVSGAPLQAGDLIDTGEAGMQIEGPDGTLLAIGPGTRLQLTRTGPAIEVGLLEGWLRVDAKTLPAAQALSVSAARMGMKLVDGTVILHAGAGREEIFVQRGQQVVEERDAKRQPLREIKLEREQFAALSAEEPLKQRPRPGTEFIAGMPRAFLDPVVPVVARLKARPAPKKDHDVAFEEIAPWLAGWTGQQKPFVARFQPRLKNPEFRQKLDARLGQTPEWKPILHPPPPASPRSAAARPGVTGKPAAETNGSVVF